jgi:hypothetical protein
MGDSIDRLLASSTGCHGAERSIVGRRGERQPRRVRRSASLSTSRGPISGRLNGQTARQIAQLWFSLK